MIQISQSKIHRYPVIYFISKGEKNIESGSFLFKESSQLFAEENLASILVEYSTNEDLQRFLKSKKFNDLVGSLNRKFKKKVTLVEVSLSAKLIKKDLVIRYSEGNLNAVSVMALEHTLKSQLKFNIQSVKSKSDLSLFTAINNKEFHSLKLTMSKKFLRRSHSKLSGFFAKSFSSRYVDSQVPFIVLTPCLMGTATKVK